MTTTTLPACWQKFHNALHAGIDRIILFGPAGTGKTFAGLSFGNTAGGSFRLACTEDMTNSEVSGSFMPDAKGGFSWVSGSALKAWNGDGTLGGRLVVDEIDRLVAMYSLPC